MCRNWWHTWLWEDLLHSWLCIKKKKNRLWAAAHESVNMVGIVSISGFCFSLNYLRKQASRNNIAWAKNKFYGRSASGFIPSTTINTLHARYMWGVKWMFGMDVKLSTASTSAEVQALDIVLLLISDKHICSHDTLNWLMFWKKNSVVYWWWTAVNWSV